MGTFGKTTAQGIQPVIYYYYVEEQTAGDLESIAKSKNANQTLTLSFADNAYDSLLSQQTVYVYEKAFPGALTERLQRMYLVGVTSNDIVDDFRAFNQIPYADFLGTLEHEDLSVPNDYFSTANIPVQSVPGIILPTDSYEHLELVSAERVWGLSTGNPNIAVGVVESPINPNHPDLASKIIQHYGSIPTSFPSGDHHHGTKVVGCVGAITDNGIGISSIGYNTSLVTYHAEPVDLYALPQQMLYLVQNHPEIKVITHSKKESCYFILANSLVYKEIWEQYGVTVITAAGNGNWKNSCPDQNGGEQGYVYPASYDHVISVSSVGHNIHIGETNSQGIDVGWKDVHEFVIGNPYYTFTHNDKVDIVAPGYGIPTTNLDNKYATGYGTSYSGPFVCGIAALMYDVNPDITPDQVKTILEDTAAEIYDIPQNAPYIGLLGAGRVNAYGAVRGAQCLDETNPQVDLAIWDSDEDKGDEPNNDTNIIWYSPEIWVRNGLDKGRGHEAPEYNPNSPSFIYVRVTNDGCLTSSGSDQLKVYWAKSSTGLYWPKNWVNYNYTNPQTGDIIPLGDLLSTVSIPPLRPGEEVILEIPWQLPNPQDYMGIIPNPWDFCLLARIESSVDPIGQEVSHLDTNVRNYNNIAWRNIILVDEIANRRGGVIAINNPFQIEKSFDLILKVDENEQGKPIYEEAEVSIEMEDMLYEAWQNGGGIMSNLQNTENERRKIVVGDSAMLGNIVLGPEEFGAMYVSFNFLTEEVTEKSTFTYHAIQNFADSDSLVGGVTYVIKKDNNRDLFLAEGGNDKSIQQNESTTIVANSINEPATYNWYDPDGNLIYTGANLNVSPDITKKYKLEIIADSDGFKDYDEVEVEVNPYSLDDLIPNPASDQVTVHYDAQEATSAYLMITNSASAVSNNYILDTTQQQEIIDLSNYISGIYVVSLVCDGKIVATGNLAIN